MEKNLTRDILQTTKERATSTENKKRILIVDDEEGIRNVIKQSLEYTGLYSVQTATGGNDAINMIKHQTFNLLITDYEMPFMNGYELLKQCKTIRPEIPVMFVTGTKLDGNMIECAKMEGLVGCVYKPFGINEIIDMVTKHSSA